MKTTLTAIAFLVFMPTNASALVFGGSNLGFMGYPSHNCIKPSEPYKPYSFNSQWEIDAYNNEVDSYNSEFKQYARCIEEYIENADNDIKRVKEKAQEAIDSYNY